MHRCPPLLAALLGLALGAGPAAAGEAVRDASLMVIALRGTRTVESRESVLAKAFDSSAPRPLTLGPEAIPGGFARRKNWFIPVYSGTLPSGEGPAGEVAPPAAPREVDDPLGRAIEAAVAPWRTLLQTAWGGAWELAAVTVLTPQDGR